MEPVRPAEAGLDRAAGGRLRPDGRGQPALSRESAEVVRQIECEPSVTIADRLDASPHDFAGAAQRVQVRRLVVLYPRGQDFGFEDGRRERYSLEVLDRVEQAVQAGSLSDKALPAGEQTDEYGRLDRLDLLAETGQRSAPHRLKDFRIAPLTSGAAGPELPFEQAARRGELLQQRMRRGPAETVARGELLGGERAVGARITTCEVRCRGWRRLQQRLGKTGRERNTERITITSGVLDWQHPGLAGNVHRDDAATAAELFERDRRVDATARRHFRRREIAQTEQQIVNAVDRSRLVRRLELLHLRFHFGERIGVEQFAQLDVTKQLAKLRLVDRQRLRATLGERRIAVVDVIRDIA